MSQLTRCPNCATTFRVSDAQLALRDGRVRCGHCSFVFNARACQVDADPVTIVDLSTDPAARGHDPFWDDEPATGTSSEPASQPAADTQAESHADSPAADALNWPAVAPTEDEAPASAPATSSTAHPRRRSTDGWLDQLEEMPPPAWLRAPSAGEDSAPAQASASAPLAAPATDVPADAPADPAPAAAPAPAAVETAPAGPVAGGTLADATWLRPARRSPWRWLWRFASLAALGSATVLAALVARQPLADRFPSLRPTLLQLCQPLQCSVRAPQDFDYLFLEGVEFSFDPEDPSLLELNAVLRNVAPWSQRWPVIDVELQDRAGRRVARRLLRPADYLPPPLQRQPEFAAEQEVQLAVSMRLQGIAVENYSVGLWRAP